MPITQIKFDTFSPLEIHLVRGQSGQSSKDLREFLELTLADGTTKSLRDYTRNDVAVLFRPTFKHQDETATEFRGFGIRVNKKTGKVTVAGGAAPSPAPANFIIEAVVTKNDGGPAPDTIPVVYLRVHVHPGIERIWFTPEELSVRARPGSEVSDVDTAFSVRAEFTDGIVADVEDFADFTSSPFSTLRGNWIRIPSSAAVGGVLDVEIKAPAAWGGKSAKAKVKVLPTWETEPNPPTAVLVDGNPDVWGGTIRPESVPNVLIVGCGFTDDAAFGEVVNKTVHELKKDPMLQPYGYLSTSMNYWRVLVPSGHAGISVRCEVETRVRDGVLVANPIQLPEPPGADMTLWGLQHLIYAVGLPVPTDISLVKDSGQPLTTIDGIHDRPFNALDFTDLYKRWTDIARAHPGHAFDDALKLEARYWIALAGRTFIDEVDVFPPIALGEREAGKIEVNRFTFNERRAFGQERTPFLQRIAARPTSPGAAPIALDNDEALGHLWLIDPETRLDPVTQQPTFNFDNRVLVAFLSNVTSGRADGTIFARMTQAVIDQATRKRTPIAGTPVKRVTGRGGLEIVPPTPVAETVEPATWQVFAHELSHSFGLGDEYTETQAVSTLTEEQLGGWANLCPAIGAVDAATGAVTVDNLKWNWHRIRKATILVRPTIPDKSTEFHLFVGRARAFQFAAGDKLLLRKRQRFKVLGRPTPLDVELTVTSIHRNNLDDPNDQRNMTIVVTTESEVDLSGFPRGSLLYEPILAPIEIRTAAHRYLTLVSPAAERIFRKIGGTFSGKVCDPTMAGIDWIPAEKDPDNKVSDPVLPVLIGAYFGGALKTCGILHPAATCLMRNSTYTPEGTPEGITSLCAVCRYALVDLIDPDKHWENDLDYAKWFTL